MGLLVVSKQGRVTVRCVRFAAGSGGGAHRGGLQSRRAGRHIQRLKPQPRSPPERCGQRGPAIGGKTGTAGICSCGGSSAGPREVPPFDGCGTRSPSTYQSALRAHRRATHRMSLHPRRTCRPSPAEELAPRRESAGQAKVEPALGLRRRPAISLSQRCPGRHEPEPSFPGKRSFDPMELLSCRLRSRPPCPVRGRKQRGVVSRRQDFRDVAGPVSEAPVEQGLQFLRSSPESVFTTLAHAADASSASRCSPCRRSEARNGPSSISPGPRRERRYSHWTQPPRRVVGTVLCSWPRQHVSTGVGDPRGVLRRSAGGASPTSAAVLEGAHGARVPGPRAEPST